MKTLYTRAKSAFIQIAYRSKKVAKNAQYAAIIASFMVNTPFSPSLMGDITQAFNNGGVQYSNVQKEPTVLVAQIRVTPYKYVPKDTGKMSKRVITAYSSTPEETDSTPFITASGSYVHFGVVAANWLPIGTAVRIPEYFGKQVFIVEDRMNKRHDDKLDVWLPTKEAAVNFGKRITKIEVL